MSTFLKLKSRLHYLNIIFRLKFVWLSGSLAVLTNLLLPTVATAEGSAQIGLNQIIYEYDASSGLLLPINRPMFVDILSAGEVINVSLCGIANSDPVEVEIYNSLGTKVYDSGPRASNVACTSSLNSPLTSPIRFVTSARDTYEIRLYNRRNTADEASKLLRRVDITVTPNTATNPNPTVAQGRLHAFSWAFNANGYAIEQSANTNYYTLVPGGRSGQNFVWLLDLNNFAGFVYEIVANNIGVDAPNSGLSTPFSGNSVTPLYPVYLGYPSVAGSRPTIPPDIASFSFSDNENVDNSISPAVTTGVQDSGTFEFTTDVDGTYAITIDTNQNGSFGAGDTLLLGVATSGTNSVFWNGRDNNNKILPQGTYDAQLAVRLGEYHFVAGDAETSGGTQPGLTIYEALPGGITQDTLVFWDDNTLLGGTTTLPNGALSSTLAGKHTWGNFTDLGFGNERYIDTYVYGDLTIATSPVIIDNSDEARANNPDIMLVKRITAINPGQTEQRSFNSFVDDPDDDKDNFANWPSDDDTYLPGEISVADVEPGDEVEYTIYFLSYGNQEAKNVKICDFVPNSMTFIPNVYGDGVGIGLALDDTTPPTTLNFQLSNIDDSDRGEFIAPDTTPPSFCKKPDPSDSDNFIPTTSEDNGSGIVIVEFNDPVPTAIDPGDPANSYGFIRFRAEVE